MERKLPQPGFWKALLLVLLALLLQVILAVPLGIVDVVFERVLHRPSPGLEREPLMVGCINVVAIGAAIALGLRLNRLPFRRAFPISRIKVGEVVGVAITILGAGVLLSEADNAFRALVPPPRWLINLLQDLFFDQGNLLSRALLLVVIAPITEELLFRGIILRGLLARHRPGMAVTLTALLFAGLHANPWQFLSALCLGIAFGWFYLRTGSVWLCVLAHAIANGLSIVFSLIPWNIQGMTRTPDFTAVVFQPWWLDVLGVGVLLAGIWAFRHATPRSGDAETPAPPPLPPVVTDQPPKSEPANRAGTTPIPPGNAPSAS